MIIMCFLLFSWYFGKNKRIEAEKKLLLPQVKLGNKGALKGP